MAAVRRDRLTWAARFGVHFRPQNGCNCDLSPGSELTGGGAGRGASAADRAGPEMYLATAVAGGPFASRAGTSLEVMLAGHVAVAPRWNVSAGVAPGLSDGAGTPGGAQVVIGDSVRRRAARRRRRRRRRRRWTPIDARGGGAVNRVTARAALAAAATLGASGAPARR